MNPVLFNILLRRPSRREETIGPLQCWLRASRISASHNDPVSIWTDPINGYSPQASSTQRPLFDTTGINGRPALLFDASDDQMLTSGAVPLLRSVDGATVFFVYQKVSDNLTPSGGFALIQSNASLRLGLNLRSGAGIYSEVVARRLDSDSAQTTTANPGYSSAPRICCIRINYRSQRLEQWLNGTLIETFSPFQTSGSSDNANVTLRVGHTSPANAKIGELLIYGAELSYSNLMWEFNNLSNIYSIAL